MKNQTIAEKLKYYRKKQGFSQDELSKETNVTVRTIQRIESAKVTPHLKTIKLLAAALGVEVEDLFPLDNPKEESIKLKWLLLFHSTPLLGLFIPFLNVIIPLFLWIHKREDNSVYNKQGIQVINFHITAILLIIISLVFLIKIEVWGFYVFILSIVYCFSVIVLNIFYVVKIGKCFYPLSIPFLNYKNRNLSSLIIVLFFLFPLVSCEYQDKDAIKKLNGEKISKDSITSVIEHLSKEANVTGLSVSIINEGKVKYQKSFGYSNAETEELLDLNHIFYGASLSKSIFAYLVAQMVVENNLDLDKPINDYFNVELPNIPIEANHRKLTDLKDDIRYKDITTRMCLSHSSGLPNWRWINNPDRKLKIQFDPGTSHSYSGEGIMLAQWLVEHIEKEPIEALAKKRIFEPLEMSNTDFLWRDEFKNHFCYGHDKNQKKLPKDIELDDAAAAGSMETTIIDYTKYLLHIYELYKEDSAVAKLLFTPNISIKSKQQFGPLSKVITTENDAINLSYGLGWALIKTPYGEAALRGGHSEGFQHYFIIFPEKDTAMLVMSNSDNAEGIFENLFEKIIGDVFTPWKWKGYSPNLSQ